MSRVIERGYAEDDEINQLNALLRLGHGLDTYDVNKLSPVFYDAINEGNRGRLDRNLISAYAHKRDPRDELQDYLDKNGAPATAPTVTPKQQKRKGDPTRKDLPTGMFAASYAPAQSTGIGWLDDLYAKDASMRYEKAFTQNTEIGKVQPKIINTGSTVDNSVRTSSTTQNQTFKMAPHLVANNNTVAVFTNK